MAVRPYKKYKGKGHKWYFKYRDEHGRWVQRAGTTSYKDTDELRAHLATQAKLIREGVLDPREASAQTNTVRPITQVVEEFADSLYRRVSDGHADWTLSYIKKCVKHTGVACLRDFTPALVGAWLKDSYPNARSHNAALKAVKQLIRWCMDRSYILFNPISAMKLRPEPQSLARKVRVMGLDEFQWLLEVAKPYRRVYYQLAAYAMIRWDEIERLTWGDVDFKNSVIRIVEGNDKAQRGDVVPLYKRLKEALVDWRRPGCKPSDTIVSPQPRLRTWKQDLERAGIEYETDAGILPRKSLRSSAITWLLELDQPLAHVAQIARHRDPKITTKHYAKLSLCNLNAVIDHLDLGQNKVQDNTPKSPLGSTDVHEAKS